MTTAKQFERLLKDAEKAAYHRGFRDATRGMRLYARRMGEKGAPRKRATKRKRRARRMKKISVEVKTRVPTRELRKGSHPHRVFEFISMKMPMRSIGIVRAMRDQGYKDRTTRTALNRLKAHGFIEKREGLWHPLF